MKQTEAEILKKRRSAEEKKKWKEEFAGYQRNVDELLRKKAYQELLDFCFSEEMQIMSKIENEAAVLNVIASIFQMEKEEGIQQGIFTEISDMESLLQRFYRIKFLLWRLEFFQEREELSKAVEAAYVSVPFFKYVIHTSCFDKVNTSYRLAMLLKDIGKPAQAFAMLNYVTELGPGERGEELTFCEMADICIQLGQLKHAAACLGKIKNPSEIFASYQERWGI